MGTSVFSSGRSLQVLVTCWSHGSRVSFTCHSMTLRERDTQITHFPFTPTMAKEKLQKISEKGQKAITSFFGGGKPKGDSSDVEIDAPRNAQNGNRSSAPDASDLPPIHSIPAMFADLVGHIPKIKDVAEHVAGRKLRVATMCSGTESPLLAMELIRKSILDQHDIDLDIEHVFSCEIEPFKQAYIERNFHPPLLFRDVCELGNHEAYVFTH